MSDLHEQLADLSADQRKLVALFLQKELAFAALPSPDRTVEREAGTFPLSFAQQRLWFLDQLAPGSAAYTIPAMVRLRGALDLGALRRSFGAVVARHAVLRTTFAVRDGQPIQRVASPQSGGTQTASLPRLIDLRGLPAAARQATTRQLVLAAVQRPFDLAAGPLLRATLLRLGAREHLLLLSMHHIIADAWSLGVLIRELVACYAELHAGRPITLPDLPIQYADFAVRQRDELRGAALDQQLAYWKKQLADLPTLALPADRPRPSVQSFRGARRFQMLSQSLLAALTELSQRSGVTLFMILLAAFQALLARLSGQDDVAVGTPIAGRTHDELEPLIGCFINMLVLRGNLAGDPTVRELARRARAVCLAAYTHQQLPFELLVEAAQAPRDLSRHPLFQVVLSLQNTPLPELAAAGLTIHPKEIDGWAAKFDLTLALLETPAGLRATWEYSSDLFDATTVARWQRHFATLLAALAAEPQQRLSALPLLSRAERQQLLMEWNDTAVEVRSQKSGVRSHLSDAWCVHELVAAQAAYTPDAVALCFDPTNGERRTINDERRTTNDEDSNSSFRVPSGRRNSSIIHLTYRELDARANQVAHHLRGLGVGPEMLVGIHVERSLDMMVGLLGILKAGGAYLPLDPAYPAERLRFMLEDSRARVLLTNNALSDKETGRQGDKEIDVASDVTLSPAHLVTRSGRTVDLRADWPIIAQRPDYPTQSGVTAENLAYAIYTSGSTGAPKGVMVPHRAVVNLLRAMSIQPGLAADDVLLAITTPAFDIAALELLLPLTTGARVALAARDETTDGTLLAAALARYRATVLQATPATWRLLLAAGWRATPRLRALCGGEALPRPLAQELLAGGAALWNMYGPTETTIWSVVGQIGPGAKPVALGWPIADTQCYVLDAVLRPAPLGAVGELYIGGAGVARGYLGRPNLTAERFVPNPFARVSGIGSQVSEDSAPNTQHPTPDTRLYRTGDLVRYRTDGTLGFLGRRDGQIKLRGYRIELGEIEAALARHPALRASAVLAREDASGGLRLVAYIAPAEGIGDRAQGTVVSSQQLAVGSRMINDEGSDSSFVVRPSSFVTELRAYLRQTLPEYMIPSAFVTLGTLPLTPNGKLDRRALPAPGAAQHEPDAAYVAPRNWAEERLAHIWAQLLDRARIGIHDNFFALGGDSLLSMQVVSRAAQVGIRIAPRQIFQHQTIAELAIAADLSSAPHAETEMSIGPVPLTPIQHWVMENHLPYTLHPPRWNTSQLLELLQPLSPPALERSLRALLQRHDSLRLRFVYEQAGWRQFSVAPGPAPFSWIDLAGLPAERQRAAIEATAADLHTSLNLARGPLIRVAFFDLGARSNGRLMLIVHHLVADGFSWEIILTDLLAAYQHISRGEPAALPPTTTTYKQWAERLIAYARSPEFARERDYWLAPTIAVAPLPIDYPGGVNSGAAEGLLTASLDAEETRRLLLDAPKVQGVQTSDALLMALAQAFERWTGERTLLVDVWGHGRHALFEDIDLSRTVGWCNVIFPVLLDLGGAASPITRLRTIAAQLRRIPNQGIGYGVLRYLSGDAGLAAQVRARPQAEVTFNYRGHLRALPRAELIRPARESDRREVSPLGNRAYLLDFRAGIVGERFTLELSYSTNLHRRSTAIQLLDSFMAALRELDK